MRLRWMGIMAWTLSSGCYLVHERPAVEIDAGVDAPPPIDVGHDAFANDVIFVPQDVSNPDAGSCATTSPSACAFDEEVDLTTPVCGPSITPDRSGCVAIDVAGRGRVDGDPNLACTTGAIPDGYRVLVRRCAPGTTMTFVVLGVVEHSPTFSGISESGVGPNECSCGQMVFANGDGGGSSAFDGETNVMRFYGDGARFHITLCATGC